MSLPANPESWQVSTPQQASNSGMKLSQLVLNTWRQRVLRAKKISQQPRGVFRGSNRGPNESYLTRFRRSRSSWKEVAQRLLKSALDCSNVCQPTPRSHLPRQKFWLILPGIQMHRIRWRASFVGGCSTPAFGTGLRKLRRQSHNSSTKVSSSKRSRPTAMFFIALPRNIGPPVNDIRRNSNLYAPDDNDRRYALVRDSGPVISISPESPETMR
jgi:hypothetical protein